MSFYTLQNSYKGAIGMDFGANGASLRFTPVFKPISPKDIQKGVKVYNYDQSQFFTIGIDELVTVEQIIDALILNGPNAFREMQGDYGAIKVSDSGLTVMHYPRGGLSKFSIFTTSNEGQAPGLMLGYELFDSNKNSQFKLYIAISITQLLVFKRYIQGQYTFMATMDALDRHHWKMKKEQNNGGQGGNNGYNKGGNNGYNKGNNNSYGGGSYGGGNNGGYNNNGNNSNGGYNRNNNGGGGYNGGNSNNNGGGNTGNYNGPSNSTNSGGYNGPNNNGNQGNSDASAQNLMG